MPFCKAVEDTASPTGYRCVPFDFQYAPLVPGRDLTEDLDRYRALSERCGGLLIGWNFLLFAGRDAEALFLRRAGTKQIWNSFEGEVKRRFPCIAERTRATAAAVSALAVGKRPRTWSRWRPTLTEIHVGAALLRCLPPRMRVMADQPLPVPKRPTGHILRSDFECTGEGASGSVRIEVTGFLDRPMVVLARPKVFAITADRQPGYGSIMRPSWIRRSCCMLTRSVTRAC